MRLWLRAAMIGVCALVVFDLTRGPRLPVPPTSRQLVDLLPLVLPKNPSEEQRACLALAIYHEARSDGWAGMEAVAHAVRNRMDALLYPQSACGVVKQGGETPPCQFSWWCDGKPDTPRNRHLHQMADHIAAAVLMDQYTDTTYGATSFHATYVRPYWTEHMKKTVEIGRHVFYR
ncbi:cell wall hydrolase [Parvularcula sp. LCG005]|uniref:cell wall hydrolase n=1 Tax=Parvularcula sp. LCG005 TaxID=3078805 RepID=UPI00294360B9|nr:cell wall hydrolase [Parvularcula sp. LCG005]WOI52332.1 cell wall hydrolase [Parvularcula sp. LCG005]